MIGYCWYLSSKFWSFQLAKELLTSTTLSVDVVADVLTFAAVVSTWPASSQTSWPTSRGPRPGKWSLRPKTAPPGTRCQSCWSRYGPARRRKSRRPECPGKLCCCRETWRRLGDGLSVSVVPVRSQVSGSSVFLFELKLSPWLRIHSRRVPGTFTGFLQELLKAF